MRTASIVALLLPLLTAPLGAQERPADLLAAAERAYAEGRLEIAANLYRRLADALPADGTRAGALISSAWLEHRLGDDDRAREALTEALVINPEHPFSPGNYTPEFVDLYYEAEHLAVEIRTRQALDRGRRGTELLTDGDAATAREALAEALELKPNDPVLLHNLAVAELELGEIDAAVAGFQKLLSLHRSGLVELEGELLSGTLSTLGGLFFTVGSHEDAAENLSQAVELDPGDGEAWHSLGVARRELGDLAGAEQALRRALELEPDDLDVVRNLARTLGEAGAWSRVVELVPPALERHSAAPDLWLSLGTAYRQRGDVDRALEALARVVELDRGNLAGLAAPASAHLAFLHLGRREWDPAAEAAARVTRWNPADAEGWSYLALAEQGRGRYAEAVAGFEKRLELEPESARGWNNLGSALMASDRPLEAETAFRRALAIDPGFETAAANLAAVEQRLLAPIKALGLELSDGAGGVAVDAVLPLTVADLGKVRAGDLLLRAGGRPIESVRELALYLRENPPGDELLVEVERQGKGKRLKLRLR